MILPVDEAIRARRAERRFGPRPLEESVLQAILEDARRAPSGFNLQPAHYIVVRGAARELLARAAFGQRQVREAPATVVVAADTRPDLAHASKVYAADLASGAVDDRYHDYIRPIISLYFRRGPLGVIGRAKGCGAALLSLLRPAPRLPAAHPREWALAQAMLAAGFLLLSAAARGVASCPMEGFDPRRVRRLIGAPRRVAAVLLVALGHPLEGSIEPPAPARRMRLPLGDLVHEGRWRQAYSGIAPAP
ncbi:MAG: nitroreductase family protein [Planctomycetes bacterium]|nr:nitroreductase family protein [Planctomycetota bacterium]